MEDQLDFVYRGKPIADVQALCWKIGVDQDVVHKMVTDASSYYRKADEIPKGDGSVRVVYDAKEPLKSIQKAIKKKLLDEIQLPEYINAGAKGRSYIRNAALHTEALVLVSDDIKNFFPSIGRKYVQKVFQYLLNMPEELSVTLTDLCVKDGFVAQGSPVSGALANLVFFDYEPSLVKAIKEMGFKYSRFYDDVHFSTKQQYPEHSIGQIRSKVYGMFKSIQVEHHTSKGKSRVMLPSGRMSVHDITVNTKKITPSKKRMDNLRLEIHKFRKSVEAGAEVSDLVASYQSIKGKIDTVKMQGGKAKHFERDLIEALRKTEDKAAKRYARGLRKVKNVEAYKKYAAKLSVISKISPRLEAVVAAERKAAKKRLGMSPR